MPGTKRGTCQLLVRGLEHTCDAEGWGCWDPVQQINRGYSLFSVFSSPVHRPKGSQKVPELTITAQYKLATLATFYNDLVL